MTQIKSHNLSNEQAQHLLQQLQERFEQHPRRHPGLKWDQVRIRLEAQPQKLLALQAMEASGGEPDLLLPEPRSPEWYFYDCAAESPTGRRSLCYDRGALDARKANKPKDSVMDMAASMGVELLTETHYRSLQTFGPFDTKTSSWLLTPADIRNHGGAIFGDFRYGQVFIYHNGADSYYAARGFRSRLKV